MEIHCWVVPENCVGVMHAQRQAVLNLEVLINRLKKKRIRILIIHETVFYFEFLKSHIFTLREYS